MGVTAAKATPPISKGFSVNLLSFDCVLSEDILAAAKDAVAKMLFNDLKDTD